MKNRNSLLTAQKIENLISFLRHNDGECHEKGKSNAVHAGINKEAVHEQVLMKFLKNCTFHIGSISRRILQWDLITSEVSNRKNIIGK